MLKISVFGSGYVGLVAASCFANVGHKVLCIDPDKSKIEKLKKGIPHIYENNLKETLESCIKNNTISFSENLKDGLFNQDIIVLAVGTPDDGTGKADISQLEALASLIGENLDKDTLIINKSTAPVGTATALKDIISNKLKNKNIKFDVYSNPEFLREGTALADFSRPDRIVIGANSTTFIDKVRDLYAPFNHNHDKIIIMDTASAELTKYASNVFLATKISFMNELAILADKTGANIHKIRSGMAGDTRIGNQFLYAGCGYGGACFPKDVSALLNIGKENLVDLKITKACQDANNTQQNYSFNKINNYFNNDLKDKKIIFWGATFKPNTDDTRESVAMFLIESVLNAGSNLSFYDPEASFDESALSFLQEKNAVRLTDKYNFTGAEALVVPTEWKEFWNPDFNLLKNNGIKVIFDFRNIFKREVVESFGLKYIGIGT